MQQTVVPEQETFRKINHKTKKTSVARGRVRLFLVFALLAVSAMEFFYLSQNYILIAFIISTFYFFVYKRKINSDFFAICAVFLIVETFQYLMFGGFNLRTFTGTYIRLFLAYSVISILGISFFRLYVKVLYFFSVVALLFYFGSFFPGAEYLYNYLSTLIPNPFESEGFYRNNPNFVIVTFNGLFPEMRNSGPFWEPGAFAVFLMLALIFNHIEDRSIWSKKNIIFIICLITTFSTASYLSLFIFILYINLEMLKKNFLYIFMFIGVMFASVYFYETLPFLKDKIENNIFLADETTTSRFGSALADLKDFSKSPVVGLGRAGAKDDFVSAKNFSLEHHRNNGIFDLLSKYGLPLTVLYFYLIYRTFREVKIHFKLSANYAFFSVFIILILGFSQGLFLKPFFYGFLFLPVIIRKHHLVSFRRYTHA